MNQDRIEFLISSYLDDTLSHEQRQELERILASDESARQMLKEHAAVDGLLKSQQPLPSIQWDRLAGLIAADVPHVTPGPAQEWDVETELAITQLIDGELSADDQAALEQRLEADSGARQVMAEHRSLDVMLKHGWPLPHVDWGRLHQHLSEAVAEQQQRARYSIASWIRSASYVAAAACVLIALGLGIRYLLDLDTPASPRPVASIVSVDSEAPAVSISGQPTMQIEIGPASADARSFFRIEASGVVRRQQQLNLQIASADVSAQPSTDAGLLQIDSIFR